VGKKSRLKRLSKVSAIQPPTAAGSLPGLDLSFKSLVSKSFYLLLCAAIILGVWLRLSNREVIYRSPDEGVYCYYARTIAAHGIQEGIRETIHQFNSDSFLWNFPTPVRIGYTLTLAAAMKITGNLYNEKAGLILSFIFSVLSLPLIFMIGARLLNRWVGLFALFFMSVSPMDLTIVRRVWQDGILGCLSGCLLLFSAMLLLKPKDLKWQLGFSCLGIYCVLFKETGMVVYGLYLFWVLLCLWFERRTGEFYKTVGFSLGVVAVVLFSVFLLIGDWHKIAEVMAHNKVGSTNEYQTSYQTGSWVDFLIGFWVLSPITVVFAAIGTAYLLYQFFAKRTSGWIHALAGWHCAFIVLVFIFIMNIPSHYKNIRLLSPVYIPLYLLDGIGVYGLLTLFYQKTRGIVLYALSLVLVFIMGTFFYLDYLNFRYVFVKLELNDIVPTVVKEVSLYWKRSYRKLANEDRLRNEEIFRKQLLDRLPNNAMVGATVSFIKQMPGRPNTYLLHHIEYGDYVTVSPDSIVPIPTRPRPVPENMQYVLLDSRDFTYFLQRSFEKLWARKKKIGDFLNSGHWGLVDQGQGMILLQKDAGDLDALFKINPAKMPLPQKALGVRIPGEIELTGVSLENGRGQHEGHILMTFYWKCFKTPSISYSPLVFLYDQMGRPVLSMEISLFSVLCPPTSWKSGDVVRQNYWFITPADLPQGPLEMRLGIVDEEHRLVKLDSSSESLLDDKKLILLGPLN
jgi:hypothetical protein